MVEKLIIENDFGKAYYDDDCRFYLDGIKGTANDHYPGSGGCDWLIRKVDNVFKWVEKDTGDTYYVAYIGRRALFTFTRLSEMEIKLLTIRFDMDFKAKWAEILRGESP